MVLVPIGIITLAALPSTILPTPISTPLTVSSRQDPSSYSSIIPLEILPSCISKCTPLFAAQAECSPPTIDSIDIECFCSNVKTQALGAAIFSETSNVCPEAGCGIEDMKVLIEWWDGLCDEEEEVAFVTSTAWEADTMTITATPNKQTANASISPLSTPTSKAPLTSKYVAQAVETSVLNSSTSTSGLLSKVSQTSSVSSSTTSRAAPTVVQASAGSRQTFGRGRGIATTLGVVALFSILVELVH